MVRLWFGAQEDMPILSDALKANNTYQDRSIRRTKSCVNNAARSSTSIGPASESRAPKRVHCGLGVLLHHAGKRHFRVPMRTHCRRTSMRIGVDKRVSHG